METCLLLCLPPTVCLTRSCLCKFSAFKTPNFYRSNKNIFIKIHCTVCLVYNVNYCVRSSGRSHGHPDRYPRC
nr:putative alpha chemokine ligand [Elephantid betaherpesvirus 1]